MSPTSGLFLEPADMEDELAALRTLAQEPALDHHAEMCTQLLNEQALPVQVEQAQLQHPHDPMSMIQSLAPDLQLNNPMPQPHAQALNQMNPNVYGQQQFNQQLPPAQAVQAQFNQPQYAHNPVYPQQLQQQGQLCGYAQQQQPPQPYQAYGQLQQPPQQPQQQQQYMQAQFQEHMRQQFIAQQFVAQQQQFVAQDIIAQHGAQHPEHCPHGNLSAEELINIKIRKRTVCYVVGLPIHVATEQKLRAREWFGQFGGVATIAINRNQKSIQANSIPAHITYDNAISALNAINFCNKFVFDDGRKLKATWGTQHYCRWFIAANKKCTNVFCGFRHSWCRPEDVITAKDIKHFRAIPAGAYTSRNIENRPRGVCSIRTFDRVSHTLPAADVLSYHMQQPQQQEQQVIPSPRPAYALQPVQDNMNAQPHTPITQGVIGSSHPFGANQL